ncbi:hypothetical protein, partial [Roseibacillus persicicus]|uniref:hypothetical protein n=1 Tax=Roseibacillus persicicus TaxID=454148 RepID=UPI00280FAA22
RFIGLISGSFAPSDQLNFSTSSWLRFPGPLQSKGRAAFRRERTFHQKDIFPILRISKIL